MCLDNKPGRENRCFMKTGESTSEAAMNWTRSGLATLYTGMKIILSQIQFVLITSTKKVS